LDQTNDRYLKFLRNRINIRVLSYVTTCSSVYSYQYIGSKPCIWRQSKWNVLKCRPMDGSISVGRNCTAAVVAVVKAPGTLKNYSWQQKTDRFCPISTSRKHHRQRARFCRNHSCDENRPEACKSYYCSHDIDADDDDNDDTLCDDGDEPWN
jgi:hypothetical protein